MVRLGSLSGLLSRDFDAVVYEGEVLVQGKRRWGQVTKREFRCFRSVPRASQWTVQPLVRVRLDQLEGVRALEGSPAMGQRRQRHTFQLSARRLAVRSPKWDHAEPRSMCGSRRSSQADSDRQESASIRPVFQPRKSAGTNDTKEEIELATEGREGRERWVFVLGWLIEAKAEAESLAKCT